MSEHCINPEEMADLHADDPRQAHLAECPRCQAVMKSFAAFMDVADVPAGAKVAEAHERLSAALDREIGIDSADSADSVGEVVRPAPGFWNPFRVRTLAAAAAVVIVAVGLSQVRLESVAPGAEPVLRGVGSGEEPFRIHLSAQEDGGIRIAWPAVEGATEYRVVVFGEDLEPVKEFEVGAEISFLIPPVRGGFFCRVLALTDGDESRRSEPAYFGSDRDH